MDYPVHINVFHDIVSTDVTRATVLDLAGVDILTQSYKGYLHQQILMHCDLGTQYIVTSKI